MAVTTIISLTNAQFSLLETTATAANDVSTSLAMLGGGFSYSTQVVPSAAFGGATVILEGSIDGATGAPNLWTTIHSITVPTTAVGLAGTTTGKPWRYIRHNTSAFVSAGAGFLNIRTYATPIG